MGMHATKERVESDTSTVYSISLVESTITTRDEPWFGELKVRLRCNRTPSYCARSYTEVLPAAFSFLVGKERRSPSEPNRPMKNKRRAKRQWRAKRMRSRHGEKEVWRRSSRAHSLRILGPKQCSLSWPNKGFGASCYAT
ncbi:unnamed protein product [Cochlearia groenlandica]